MKTMKRFLSMLLMFMLILQCAPIAFADGETVVTLSSDVNGLVGVPVNAKIPITFSADVAITESDVTVSPADAFTLEGSGTSYAINFIEDTKYGTVYTVSTSYGTVSYTTAYDTDVAKIDYGTLSGSWKSATFGKDLSELTLKITFSELTTSKGVWLVNDGVYISRLLIDTVSGTDVMVINGYAYDNGTVKGIGAQLLNIAATDTVYITYKDNTIYPFKVSSDGTVTYGTSGSYSSFSTAGSTFDEMRITSAVTCVSVGDTVTPNADDGNTDGEYVEVNCTATSTIDGLPGVPLEANIPVTISGESVELTPSNVRVTSGENRVNNVVVTGESPNYTLSFEKEYNTNYSIEIGNGDPITFKTVYNTDVANFSLNNTNKLVSFGKNLAEITLKVTFSNKPASGTGIWLTNGGTSINDSAKYVSKLDVDSSAGTATKLNAFWYDTINGKYQGDPTGANISGIEVTDTVYVTYSGKTIYMCKVSSDGALTYGTSASYADYTTSNNTFNQMFTTSAVIAASVGGIEVPAASEISIEDVNNSAVTASYAFTTAKSRKIICAVYDVSGEAPVLLDAETKDVSNLSDTLYFTLDSKSKTNLKYKLFALSNLNDVTPVVKASEYPAN